MPEKIIPHCPEGYLRRTIGTCAVETRQAGGKDFRFIVGYAAKFNVLSDVLKDWAGPFRERILPGAFDSVLTNDVRALENHNSSLLLGRTLSGTLKLSVDNVGLHYEIEPPNTTYARDLLEKLDRKDISGSSFQFRVAKDGDAWLFESGMDIHQIRSIGELLDVGPVTFPAYPQTEADTNSTRSRHEYINARNDHKRRELMARQKFLSLRSI